MVESSETMAGVLVSFFNGQTQANNLMTRGILTNHRRIVLLGVVVGAISVLAYKNHKRIKALEYRVATLEDETQFTE